MYVINFNAVLKKIEVVLLIAALSLAFSCSKIIEVELPEVQTKPIVNCLFSPGEPFHLHISLTKKPTDTVEYIVNNASIQIIGDNGIIANPVSLGNGYYTDKTILAQEGTTYFLKVNIPGYQEVRSTSKIEISGTSIVEVRSEEDYNVQAVMGTGEEASIKVQKLTIAISHNTSSPDYMGVSVIEDYLTTRLINESEFSNGEEPIIEEVLKYRLGYMNSEDPIITTEGLETYDTHNILLFKDELFERKPQPVEMFFEKETETKFWLRFFQFSPEAFKYLKSWIIHGYTKEYDFWEVYEPLPLYSNIENGYGIFAGYSMQQFRLTPNSTNILEQ